MMHWGYGYGMGLGMILWWIIIIGGIVLAFYGLFSLAKGQPNKKEVDKGIDALDILKERFAKGEINEEEYEQKKKILIK
ncbi:MAG: putative rane protein [Clostridia bacterium]|jgi:putative membrane protein|nr:putative rane protein [Clostridia bacterium]MDN5322233.1 putative rane protein [Clostridia bacterium]